MHVALDDAHFASRFPFVIADICNAMFSGETADVITSSWLVGLPKPDGGVRPLAMGSCWLKVAAGRACAVSSNRTKPGFANLQYGVRCPGGAEYIVHYIRMFVRTGSRGEDAPPAGKCRVVATIDLKNAFNMPFRQAMAYACADIPELHGIFRLSYGGQSYLFLKGSDGKLHLRSKRGSRQGDAAGVDLFALVINKILRDASRFPGVSLLAYLDDATLGADSNEELAECISFIFQEIAKLGMKENAAKCEVMKCVGEFTADELAKMSPSGSCSVLAPFARKNCIKLLGASVGVSDTVEAEHLQLRLGSKNATALRRAALGPSTQILQVVRVSLIPGLTHAMRTHAPHVTSALALGFDSQISSIMASWCATDQLTPEQNLLMQLPLAAGGLGLTSNKLIAPAAYKSSSNALVKGVRIVRQKQLTALIYTDAREKLANSSEVYKLLLEHNSLDGASAFWFNTRIRTHADVFSVATRTRLGVFPTRGALSCHGCRASLEPFDWWFHGSGCVRTPGNLPNHRHSVLSGWLASLANSAGLAAEREPRRFAIHTCSLNQALQMSYDEYLAHKLECCGCAKARPDTSGPDIAVTLTSHSTGSAGCINMALDVTVIEALSKSNRSSTVPQLFEKVDATKSAKYASNCSSANYHYSTIACTSNGHLSPQMRTFIVQIADTKRIPRKDALDDFSALVVGQTSQSTLTSLRAAGIAPRSLHIDTRSSPLARSFVHVDLPAEDPSAPVRQAPLLPTPPQSVSQRMDSLEKTLELLVKKLKLTVGDTELICNLASRAQEEEALSARRQRMPSISRQSPVPAANVDPDRTAFRLRSAQREFDSIRDLNAETIELHAALADERAASTAAADNARFEEQASAQRRRQASVSRIVGNLAEIATLQNLTDRANAQVVSIALKSDTSAVAFVSHKRTALATSSQVVGSALDSSSRACSATMAKAVLEATAGVSALTRAHEHSKQLLPSGPLPPPVAASNPQIDRLVHEFRTAFSQHRGESPDPTAPDFYEGFDETLGEKMLLCRESVDREIQDVEAASKRAAAEEELRNLAEFDAAEAVHDKRMQRDIANEKLLRDELHANEQMLRDQTELHSAYLQARVEADKRAAQHQHNMGQLQYLCSIEAERRAKSLQQTRDAVDFAANRTAEMESRVDALRSQSYASRSSSRSSARESGMVDSPSSSDEDGAWMGQQKASKVIKQQLAAARLAASASQGSSPHSASSRHSQNFHQTSSVNNAAQQQQIGFRQMPNESNPWPSQPAQQQPAAASASKNFFTQNSASATKKGSAFNQPSANPWQQPAQQQPR